MKNKKGSLAFDWIYGLAFLISLGLLYIVFNQVIDVHLVPAIENTIPDTFVGKSEIVQKNSEWLSYWAFIPFLLVFIILAYWFVAGVRQGKNSNI